MFVHRDSLMTDVWNKPKHAASNNARITAYKVIVNCLLIYPSEDVQMQLHTSCFPNVCFCSITAAGKLILATTQEQKKNAISVYGWHGDLLLYVGRYVLIVYTNMYSLKSKFNISRNASFVRYLSMYRGKYPL